MKLAELKGIKVYPNDKIPNRLCFEIGSFQVSTQGVLGDDSVTLNYPRSTTICFHNTLLPYYMEQPLYNDSDLIRRLHILSEIQAYLEGVNADKVEHNASKFESGHIVELLKYCREQGANIFVGAEDFRFTDHTEYDEKYKYVRIQEFLDGNLYGEQSNDGTPFKEHEKGCYVFPNAKEFALANYDMRAAGYYARFVYAVLDRKEAHVHFPIEIVHTRTPEKSITVKDMNELVEAYNNIFDELKKVAATKNLSLPAYLWLETFGENRLKRLMDSVVAIEDEDDLPY